MMLKHKFGNIFRAWREHFDPDDVGRLSFHMFCNSVRSLGYSGNVSHLWDGLAHLPSPNAVGKFILLTDIAPEEGKLMEEFKECLLSKHERSYVKAWKSSLA